MHPLPHTPLWRSAYYLSAGTTSPFSESDEIIAVRKTSNEILYSGHYSRGSCLILAISVIRKNEISK
jgi:hypothetical protein